MRILALILIFAVVAPALFSQNSEQTAGPQPMPTPPVPYYDWKACPFEGCAYRQWTALSSVIVHDTWMPTRHSVAKLVKGDKVLATSGVVITFRPGLIRVEQDLPDQQLQQGDTVLTYAYRGEGFSAVWYKGKYDPSFDISFAKWPDGTGCAGDHCAGTYVDLGEKEWWAEVKLASGLQGWVNIPLDMTNAKFDGMDALASLKMPSR
jgi:hypothetical protein